MGKLSRCAWRRQQQRGRKKKRIRFRLAKQTTLHVQHAILEHFFAVTARLRSEIA